jgi:cytochrome c-type biogenesis protein CcmF
MIGEIFVKLAFASILLACGGYYYTFTRGDGRSLNVARYAYHTGAILILSFCSYLLYLILTHQFQYTYVWNYSSTDLLALDALHDGHRCGAYALLLQARV